MKIAHFSQRRVSNIRNAVALAVAVAPALLSQPALVLAQESNIETVVVTGSRIRGLVSDAPRPISSLAIEDLQLSGVDSVTDALRESSFNTLGSYTQQSGSSFGGVALVSLKGIGADRTAVLVNGRRVPGNPWTGTSAVDMNTMPLAAVDRIEVLTDSASAVYGADAIGGAINIIMKDDWTGAEVSLGGARPSRDSANTDSLSFSFGTSFDRGSLIFSGEWYQRLPVYDRDRDYSNVQVKGNSGPNGNPLDGSADVQGINGGGNSLFALNFSQALGYPGNCDNPGLLVVDNPFGVPGTGCGFGYGDFSWQNAGLERRATYTSAKYELTDNIEAFVENRFVSVDSGGRFAPAIGGFFFSSASSQNTLGQDAILYHRFVGHGTRDDSRSSREIDTTMGLRGTVLNGDVNFEAYYRDYRFTALDQGRNYILSSIISDLVADDEYNVADPFDPSNADAILQSRADIFRDIFAVWEGWGATFDGELEAFSLAGGNIGWAAGLESARENYGDKYDSYREAGNVIGSAGNSSGGGRSRDALFAEVNVPLLENLSVNIAGRYDDYNDFGSEFSPQMSVRYVVTDYLTLRGSLGEGFKAPNLTSMYQFPAQSFESTADITRCRAQGISDDDCPNSQIETFTGGNPDLQAEESQSWNLGLIVNPIEGLTLSADWWNIELTDGITSVGETTLFELEQLGALPSGVKINRAPAENGVPGAITRCEGSGLKVPDCGLVNVFANLATIEYEGLDIRGRYDLNTDFGAFTLIGNLSNIRNISSILPVIGPDPNVGAGLPGQPENRANFTLRYSLNDLTLSYDYAWIDEHSNQQYFYESWDTHGLNATWQAPFGSIISLGVRNITDEDPVIERNQGWNSTTSRAALEFYSVNGRMFTASLRHSF